MSVKSLAAFDLHTPASRDFSRLQILRNKDTKREWLSLDDVRVCVLCGNELRGRDILIKIQSGHAVCHCPTVGCHGTMRHFVLPGNPLLDSESWTDWMAAFEEPGESPAA